jgi:Ser/Thr protein kinase RdoA (MazF antagonist)
MHTLPPAFQAAIQHALLAFGLEDAAGRVLKHGTTTTIRVVAPGGASYAIRFQLQRRMPLRVVLAELAWLQAIHQVTPLQVPQPQPTRDGQLALLVTPEGTDPLIATCFAWLPGRHKHHVTPDDAWRMGKTLGCLHHFSRTYQLPAGLERWDFDREAFTTEHGPAIRERLSQHLEHADWQAVHQAFRFVVEALHRVDQEPGSYGLIQADTNLTNWLFQCQRVALLDFEVCCNGYYVFDIGRVLHSMAETHANHAALTTAFASGYQTRSALPPIGDMRLTTGMLMSLIDCVVWACDLPTALQTPELYTKLDRWLAQIQRLIKREWP